MCDEISEFVSIESKLDVHVIPDLDEIKRSLIDEVIPEVVFIESKLDLIAVLLDCWQTNGVQDPACDNPFTNWPTGWPPQ